MFLISNTNVNIVLLMTAIVLKFNTVISIAISVHEKSNNLIGFSDNVCKTFTCNEIASTIHEKMDFNIDPCDNFYEFVCGNFIKNTNIPDDKIAIESLTSIDDKLAQGLKSSLEDPSPPDEFKSFKLAKNFYKACMNKTTIEKRGHKPLKKILNDLGGWPVLEGSEWNETNFHWTESVYKFRKAGYSINYFLKLNVGADLIDTNKKVLQLKHPEKSGHEYLSNPASRTTLVNTYYQYMIDIAVILGAPSNMMTSKELKDALDFELSLFNIMPSDDKLRNATLLHNPMTVAELSKYYSSIPWKEYINKIVAPHMTVDDNEIVIVTVPDFIFKFIKLINNTPKRIQANYVIWKAIEYSVKYLTHDMLDSQFKFEKELQGVGKVKARWETCVQESTNLLSTHALYVKKYFNEVAKYDAIEMVADIKKELIKILQTVDWLDEETRKNALNKAVALSSYIGYPTEFINGNALEELYKNLEFNDDNFLENQLKLNHFILNCEYSNFRKPLNKSDWTNHAKVAMVNTFYNRNSNSIDLPAGILQGLLFSNDRPKYINYGAIGFFIGHEITHGFDYHGQQRDEHGNLRNWCTPLTNEKFLRKAQCIVDQYSNYTIKEIGKKLNGKLTEVENISDNGGIKIAYLAYQDWSKRHGEEQSLPGLAFNSRQMYWISAATVWCAKYQPVFLENIIESDPHSPGEFRVLGSFSNMPEFGKDFNCSLGSNMNPKNKCQFW